MRAVCAPSWHRRSSRKSTAGLGNRKVTRLYTFVILAHQVSTTRVVVARAADATDALEAEGGLWPMASCDSARKNPVAGMWQVIQAGRTGSANASANSAPSN